MNNKKEFEKRLVKFYNIKEQEKCLDYWCKLTNRDIFIVYPKKKDIDIVKYLNKEIRKTIKLYAQQTNNEVKQNDL